MMHPATSRDGFTLVELLVAFSILLIGMTGVITMFATGLSLEREASLSFEAVTVLEDLRPEVEARLQEAVSNGNGQEPSFERRPVEGYPGLQYEVRATAVEDEPGLWLVDIVVLAPTTGGFREFHHGHLPMVAVPSYEERVRRALSER